MKKGLLLFIASVFFAACSSESENEVGEQTAKFYITYTLDERVGQDMTRSATSDAWKVFYEKIKSGNLVSEGYEITFKSEESGQSYTFNGKWANRDMFMLPVGTYKVTGTSKAVGDRIQDRCSLAFDTTINIEKDASSIRLPASYDCFLLAFKKDGIKTIINHYWEAHHTDGLAQDELFVYGDYIYCFVNDKLAGQYYTSDYNYISGEFDNGSTFRIETYEVNFEKGKYYIYTTVPSSFDIPEMESGM